MARIVYTWYTFPSGKFFDPKHHMGTSFTISQCYKVPVHYNRVWRSLIFVTTWFLFTASAVIRRRQKINILLFNTMSRHFWLMTKNGIFQRPSTTIHNWKFPNIDLSLWNKTLPAHDFMRHKYTTHFWVFVLALIHNRLK